MQWQLAGNFSFLRGSKKVAGASIAGIMDYRTHFAVYIPGTA
jgi:hypothetical protein